MVGQTARAIRRAATLARSGTLRTADPTRKTGAYLLSLVAVGLIAFGVFLAVRARRGKV